jgi:hypothetical protein
MLVLVVLAEVLEDCAAQSEQQAVVVHLNHNLL